MNSWTDWVNTVLCLLWYHIAC